MDERISLRCRSCNGHTIFIGKGGHLTCSYIDCKEPSIERQIAQLEAELGALKEVHANVIERVKERSVEFEQLEAENQGLREKISLQQAHVEQLVVDLDALKEDKR